MIGDAVKRPGRFDKNIFKGIPDLEARTDAFKTHLKQKPHNITKWLYIGEETDYYTFAKIKFVVDETARIVASQLKNIIELNDIIKVVVKNPSEFT